MKRLFISFAALMLTCAAMACTNFLVGKLASDNGQTMISYAADSYNLYGFLRFQPAADHEPGAVRKIYDWDTNKYLGEIPEVAHTYSVIGNMNEKQLSIGETTYGGRAELNDSTGLIDYGSLIYVALERCATAREAVLCIADLACKYGYYSDGESFSIADPNEIWVMELIGKGPGNTGIVWVATRIPDDCISAHANQARITTLPLKKAKPMKGNKQIMTNMVDGQEWWWSKDVITFAREKGYFSGNDADFSFADAYAPLDLTGAYACEGRVWSFFRKYDSSIDQYLPYVMHQNNDHMPLFIKPNRKLSAADMRAAMRDMYEGTPLDIQQQEGSGIWHSKLRYGGLLFELDSTQYCYPRPTATQQTAWSFVSEMYADKRYGTYWFGIDDAATSVYIPFFSCTTEVPHCMKQGNGDLYTYSHTSAFWAFNQVANYAYTKYERMLPEICFRQAEWEKRFEEDLDRLEMKTGKMSDEVCIDYLNRYSSTQAEAVIADWHQLFGYLIVKYIDGVEKKQDDQGNFLRNELGEPVSPNRLKPAEDYLRQIAPAVAH